MKQGIGNNKNVTILALHLGYGGIEKFIVNIANMFSDSYSVKIISTYKLYDKPVFDLNSNVEVEYLLNEKLKPNKQELLRSIKKINIISFLKQLYISIKILTLKKYKMINAIKRVQNGIVISTRYTQSKWLGKYGNNNLTKIATEHNYYLDNKKEYTKVIKSCKNINYLVLSTSEQVEFYRTRLSKEKVVRIPLALDSISTKLSELNSNKITYIGRLAKDKGIIDLIEVLSIVYKYNHNILLNIVGNGEEYENAKSKISEYKLDNNVVLHGYKNKAEIEEILVDTSLGINASYSESFGLAVLETLNYGIPCIAFDSAVGLADIIDNEKNGYIIKNRNKEEMAKKIVELFEDKNKLKELGNSAREKSLKFSEENIKSKWKELVEH